MDHEEREEVPWSNLVADLEQGVDRRWFIAAAVLVAVVGAFFALRIFAGPTQPSLSVAQQPVPGAVGESTSTSTTLPALTEADLTTEVAVDTSPMAVARAEWFITDYFTVDGSLETSRSLREAIAPELASVDLPQDGGGLHTYVEWARATNAEDLGTGRYRVTVLYRTIENQEGVFERLPVMGAHVIVDTRSGRPIVESLPVATTDHWGGW